MVRYALFQKRYHQPLHCPDCGESRMHEDIEWMIEKYKDEGDKQRIRLFMCSGCGKFSLIHDITTIEIDHPDSIENDV